MFGVQATIDIHIEEVKTNFKDIFIDLGEADGLIDTFKELGEAIGSTADMLKAFNKAEAEMANSGRVSIETALQLMEYTDDYGSVLEVVDGKLRLVDGAENILIQTRIDAIKTSAQASLADATAAYEKAKLATQTYKDALTTDMSAEVVATSWNKVLASAAGLWEGIKSLFTDESWTDAYNRAYNSTLSNITGYETEYTDEGLQALIDAEEEAKKGVDNAQDRVDLLTGLTPDTLEDMYESDDVNSIEDVVKNGWDKIVSEYENKLALLSNERDLIEAEIDKAEAQGGKASAQYYEDLIRNSNEEKALLEAKKKALEDYLAANAGSIDPDTWTEYNNAINETAVAIKECEVNTIEWAEALREIDIHYFEQAIDEISRLGEEIEFVQGLLEDEDVADENGNWTSAGMTRLGLYVNQMEIAAAKAQQYQEEIDKLNTQYANGELSEEQYQEQLSNLVSGQQDAIQSYEDAKDGIVELNEARIDAIKDGIEKEIEAYEDLIDLKKEELDAERDLYDFRKNVKKQTKDIATLERRIAALSGSTAAADVAERRKLQAELNDAREGLNDTYYERSRDQQNQALDDEAETFRESREKYIEELEATLEDVETLITDSIMEVLQNADTVLAQLNEISDTYGIDLSGALTKPWEDAANKPKDYWNNARDAVSGYADFLTGSELGNKFSKTITGFGNQIQTIIDKWNGVKTAAEAAYEAQNREVTVGGVNTGSSGSGSGSSGSGSSSSGSGNANVAALQAVLNTVFSAGLVVDGKMGSATTNALRTAQSKLGIVADGKYGTQTRNAIISYIDRQIASWRNIGGGSQVGQGIQVYTNAKKQLPLQLAKGTLGLTKDQFAITDESWIGEEITLAAGRNGQLQYLKKGSAVMPADISANLVKWGKLDPNMLGINGGANINMINNSVNKPEIKLEIAELLHVERVDKDTLPELEKFVNKKMDDLVRQLNYGIKKYK